MNKITQLFQDNAKSIKVFALGVFSLLSMASYGQEVEKDSVSTKVIKNKVGDSIGKRTDRFTKFKQQTNKKGDTLVITNKNIKSYQMTKAEKEAFEAAQAEKKKKSNPWKGEPHTAKEFEEWLKNAPQKEKDAYLKKYSEIYQDRKAGQSDKDYAKQLADDQNKNYIENIKPKQPTTIEVTKETKERDAGKETTIVIEKLVKETNTILPPKVAQQTPKPSFELIVGNTNYSDNTLKYHEDGFTGFKYTQPVFKEWGVIMLKSRIYNGLGDFDSYIIQDKDCNLCPQDKQKQDVPVIVGLNNPDYKYGVLDVTFNAQHTFYIGKNKNGYKYTLNEGDNAGKYITSQMSEQSLFEVSVGVGGGFTYRDYFNTNGDLVLNYVDGTERDASGNVIEYNPRRINAAAVGASLDGNPDLNYSDVVPNQKISLLGTGYIGVKWNIANLGKEKLIENEKGVRVKYPAKFYVGADFFVDVDNFQTGGRQGQYDEGTNIDLIDANGAIFSVRDDISPFQQNADGTVNVLNPNEFNTVNDTKVQKNFSIKVGITF